MDNKRPTEEDYIRYTVLVRGQIIERCVNLERHIDLLLAEYFSMSNIRREDLINLILGTERISMSGKLEVLDSLVKNNKVSINGGTKTIKSIKSLIEKRNVFAHQTIVDISERVEGSFMTFRKYKTSVQTISYTKDEIIDLLNEFKEHTIKVREEYLRLKTGNVPSG